uniref:Uncharacterized protein n=1 Tax=candidate division WOR-3 bacterium TaxID=2052148 RepID=A0A7C6EBK1_UNCW3
MKKLTIDQKDLFFAFENRMPETSHYLNLETGEIIPVFAFNRKRVLEVIKKEPNKYVKIKPLSTKESFQIMKDYIETVPVPQIRKELQEALFKKGAFRSFRAVINKYPEEKEHFSNFKFNAILNRIKNWLAQFDIELELKI